MANNPYVNKVVFGAVSIIDITPTTAQEADVAQGKVFFKADGSMATGTHQDSGVTVTTTQDSHGGDIVTITGAVLVTYYTGSSAPSSSFGIDGDIYLQT